MATAHHTKYAAEFYITLNAHSVADGIRMEKSVPGFS